ncbi:hypothetical protein VNO80_28929 [Phaseolus coccineus]|uniref:Uncharacterized protein n=1 Tax=Phaseolus coccineus TaxID=3886 RepID=A0AAN9QEJ1_PHACN
MVGVPHEEQRVRLALLEPFTANISREGKEKKRKERCVAVGNANMVMVSYKVEKCIWTEWKEKYVDVVGHLTALIEKQRKVQLLLQHINSDPFHTVQH